MGGFSLGCGLGWSAPCVEILKSGEHRLDVFATDVIAAMFPMGAALGTLAVPLLIDTVGRKWTMMILVPVFVAGWILLVCAGTLVPLFVIGRIVTGACGGMFCVAAPMYSAEISEKQIRGRYPPRVTIYPVPPRASYLQRRLCHLSGDLACPRSHLAKCL